MTQTERLPLESPSAIAGARDGIWVADAGSKSAVLFDAASAAIHASVRLDEEPRSIAAGAELVAVALASGDVIAMSHDNRELRWRRRTASGNVALATSRDRVWAWDRGASSFLAWDQAGNEERFDGVDAVAFAPSDKGVYSLISSGALRFQSRAGGTSSARLPDDASPVGAMLFCANSLWIGVPNGLMLAARDTLEARAIVPVPEPEARHLVCHGGRVFGAGRAAVFSIEPAADANARSLGVTLRSAPMGLGISGRHLWALESAAPDVHIVQIP